MECGFHIKLCISRVTETTSGLQISAYHYEFISKIKCEHYVHNAPLRETEVSVNTFA
jgi:hypothetical protein